MKIAPSELGDFLSKLFESDEWPKPLHLLQGLRLIQAGSSIEEAARLIGTTVQRLSKVHDSPDAIQEILHPTPDKLTDKGREKTKQIIGQLILGRCAELAFEDIYKKEMATEELDLVDTREGGTDTDYRLYNGAGKAIYRINIKFHGSYFRKAKDLVGLKPEDCFPLATYKILAALQKQEKEHLPYIFVIVGVRHLVASSVAEPIEASAINILNYLRASKKLTRKRKIEDRFVDYLVREKHPVISENYHKIRSADWHIISARRAEKLLREHLFERVYALRVRSFTQSYRGAEVDMHFSISHDLTTLSDFLHTIRTDNLYKVTAMLSDGAF
jgi:hypothetical protein